AVDNAGNVSLVLDHGIPFRLLSAAADADGDGVADTTDNCLLTANADQADFDGDGIGDACDLNAYNDASLDVFDQFPLNNGEWYDGDGDGIGDNSDSDSDNDGVLDDGDNCVSTANVDQADFDGDGLGDACDNDSDDDGVPNSLDAFPLDAARAADLDGDGVADDALPVDNCPAVPNPDQADSDNNGIGDACELGSLPLAVDDDVTTAEDTAVTFTVTGNDSDPDGNLDVTTTVSTTNPAHGALVNEGNGSFTYTPDANYSGSDSFSYAVCDSEGGCATALVNITIAPVNDAPVVGPISAPADPVAIQVMVNVTAVFTDVENGGTHTAVWDWGDGSTSSGTITYASGAGNVADSHTYSQPGVYTVLLTVTDNNGGWGQAEYQYIVVYDPNGGFITGAGQVISPDGA
ncbi:MAG: tandem-95 repeat protein, partial [Anaerolineales bacterium]|nr:tandem-95 repeat protein [Anaerolineales bacterium]